MPHLHPTANNERHAETTNSEFGEDI